jgi:hypothetical protein
MAVFVLIFMIVSKKDYVRAWLLLIRPHANLVLFVLSNEEHLRSDPDHQLMDYVTQYTPF